MPSTSGQNWNSLLAETSSKEWRCARPPKQKQLFIKGDYYSFHKNGLRSICISNQRPNSWKLRLISLVKINRTRQASITLYKNSSSAFLAARFSCLLFLRTTYWSCGKKKTNKKTKKKNKQLWILLKPQLVDFGTTLLDLSFYFFIIIIISSSRGLSSLNLKLTSHIIRCDWLITLTQPCDWLSPPNVVPNAQRSLTRSWPPVPRLNLEKRRETRGYNDIDGILLVDVRMINLINKSHYMSFHLIRFFLAQ